MGQKMDEFLRRLQEGCPADEAAVLQREAERERAREREPKRNLLRYRDEHMQRLSDLWFSQRATAAVEQKNAVGLAYISHVLGLGDDAARRFAEGDRNVDHQVGLRHAGSERYTADLEKFWAQVREIFPGVYTDDDVSFLVEHGGVEATWSFQGQLEIPLAEDSPVLRALLVNAHAYK